MRGRHGKEGDAPSAYYIPADAFFKAIPQGLRNIIDVEKDAFDRIAGLEGTLDVLKDAVLKKDAEAAVSSDDIKGDPDEIDKILLGRLDISRPVNKLPV
jgi:hypothetical protein